MRSVTPAKAGVQMKERDAALRLHHGEPSQRHALYRRHRQSPRRVWEHRESVADGFTKRYGVQTLVYFELHATMEAAITREKQLKEWHRVWKIRLIESVNPGWKDLSNPGSKDLSDEIMD